MVMGREALEWAISQAERKSRETETLMERQLLRRHADALRVIRVKMGWHPSAQPNNGSKQGVADE